MNQRDSLKVLMALPAEVQGDGGHDPTTKFVTTEFNVERATTPLKTKSVMKVLMLWTAAIH